MALSAALHADAAHTRKTF